MFLYVFNQGQAAENSSLSLAEPMVMNGTFTSHQVASGNDSITAGWRCAEICADLSSLCIRGSATLTLCYAKPYSLIQSLNLRLFDFFFF